MGIFESSGSSRFGLLPLHLPSGEQVICFGQGAKGDVCAFHSDVLKMEREGIKGPRRRRFDRKRAARDLARSAKLPAMTLLRCRVRSFTAGAVLGGRAFVDGVFRALRDRFGGTRIDGARRLCGLDSEADMFALRDLRRDVFG